MKIAVIGAGVCGLAAARTLCSRGHSVTLYEQFDLFHDRGSSHGASRIIRRAYPDPFYTACMAEAYPMWADLEAVSQRSLVHECGLLYFGLNGSPKLQSVIDGLAMLNVPFDVLDAKDTLGKFPQLRLESNEIAVWTPEAGWVDSAGALRALYELAVGNGLLNRIGVQADPLALSKENDVVILAAGAWTQQYLPIPAHVTLQTFAYIGEPLYGPVWIEDSADQQYGIPSDSKGQKLGVHSSGPIIDPSDLSRNPSPDVLEIIRRTASQRFGIENPTLEGAKACLYTTTANEDFLLGRLAPNVFFASACSGHGFKFGPWIGRLLADFAEGSDAPENHTRFFFAP